MHHSWEKFADYMLLYASLCKEIGTLSQIMTFTDAEKLQSIHDSVSSFETCPEQLIQSLKVWGNIS